MHDSSEHVVNFANAQQHELPESGLLFFTFVGVILQGCKGIAGSVLVLDLKLSQVLAAFAELCRIWFLQLHILRSIRASGRLAICDSL